MKQFRIDWKLSVKCGLKWCQRHSLSFDFVTFFFSSLTEHVVLGHTVRPYQNIASQDNNLEISGFSMWFLMLACFHMNLLLVIEEHDCFALFKTRLNLIKRFNNWINLTWFKRKSGHKDIFRCKISTEFPIFEKWLINCFYWNDLMGKMYLRDKTLKFIPIWFVE